MNIIYLHPLWLVPAFFAGWIVSYIQFKYKSK